MSPDLISLIKSGQFVCLREYPGYGVSANGQVWTCRATGRAQARLTEDWRPLKGRRRSRTKHLWVCLCINWQKTYFGIHQLILQAFIGPCPDGMECCHVNDVADDNRLENLRYGTPRLQGEDRIRNGCMPRGGQCSWAKLTEEDVRAIRAQYIDRYGEQTKLAREYGVNPATIRAIVRGVNWNGI